MNFENVILEKDLAVSVKVLNDSHLTVAKEFNFTKQSNPTNNAFIDVETLRTHLSKGIDLYLSIVDNVAIGCIAIEKSSKEIDTYYIEKVSILPEYRHNGYGIKLMDFASDRIKNSGGKKISIALIDSNTKLKEWYLKQGFIETSIKDFEHLPFRVCFMSKQP
jgi:ribosomal protein S18 acetylase RimI-like enzyme